MAQTSDVFAVDGVIAHIDTEDGGTIYRRDKYIILSGEEWDTLFSVDFDFDNLQPTLPLLENGNIRVGIDISCNVPLLDIRHWYDIGTGNYSPSDAGVKIQKRQWDAIKKWANSRSKRVPTGPLIKPAHPGWVNSRSEL